MTTTTAKLTVSLGTGTVDQARAAATAAGLSLSAWLDQAARDKIRQEGARALAEFNASPAGAELEEFTRATAATAAARWAALAEDQAA